MRHLGAWLPLRTFCWLALSCMLRSLPIACLSIMALMFSLF